MVIGVLGQYHIIQEKAKRSYIVANTKGTYEQHGHFKKVSTCYLVIDLMNKKKVPKSPYLLEAIIRITSDEKYKARLQQIQINRSNKQMYYNVNKGVNR